MEAIPASKRDMLAQKAEQRTTSAITFQDFVNVVSSFFYVHFILIFSCMYTFVLFIKLNLFKVRSSYLLNMFES
ncbi:hypothetical protein O3M35_006231 [Rhynocoris fuscipes]|uniref:Uncharacterized protein n=1 Tax=Rhynocoris fuscipes TaxID=488301 RepID=A0AAW1DJW6_9HEMI